jgi:DNA-binding PadR family transcriptional regulator
MQTYKLNLLLVNSRYGDLERRVIREFVRNRGTNEFWWFEELKLFLLQLVENGLLRGTGQIRTVGGLVQQLYKLTDVGREYINLWPTE